METGSGGTHSAMRAEAPSAWRGLRYRRRVSSRATVPFTPLAIRAEGAGNEDTICLRLVITDGTFIRSRTFQNVPEGFMERQIRQKISHMRSLSRDSNLSLNDEANDSIAMYMWLIFGGFGVPYTPIDNIAHGSLCNVNSAKRGSTPFFRRCQPVPAGSPGIAYQTHSEHLPSL